jgi:hypothetical protein
MMEDRETTNVEAAAEFERRRAPAWPEDEPDRDDLADLCARCGRELLYSEGPLCRDCEERR